MSKRIKPMPGNPVYIVIRGFEGIDVDLFGVLGYKGKKFFIRTNISLIEVNLRDIIYLQPVKSNL